MENPSNQNHNIRKLISQSRTYTESTQNFFYVRDQFPSSRLQTEESSLYSYRSEDKINTSLNLKRMMEMNFCFNLSEKGLSNLPLNIPEKKLIETKVLELKGNKFFKIGIEISLFKNIQYLKIDNNVLREIDGQLFNQIKLRYLSLSNNYLKNIPIEIKEQADSLEYLNFSYNFVVNLPIELCLLKKLRSLHINNNAFIEIPVELLNKFSELQELCFDWLKYSKPSFPLLFQSNNKKKFPKLHSIKNNLLFSDFIQLLSKQRVETNKIELIFDSILNEDMGVTRFLISEHPNLINALNITGHTPISLAIKEEKYLSAKILIQNGCDVNLGGKNNFGSPLNIAVTKLQLYLVKDLIKYGADVSIKDPNGNSVLFYLFKVWDNDPEISFSILSLLVENGISFNIKNNEGFTILHLCLKTGWNNIFQKCIENFKNIIDFSIVTSERKLNYLHLAVMQDNINNVINLLKIENLTLWEEIDSIALRPIHYAKMNYTYVKLLRLYEKRNITQNIKKNFTNNEKSTKKSSIEPISPHSNDNEIYDDDSCELLHHKMAQITNLPIKSQNFFLRISKNLPINDAAKNFYTHESSDESIASDLDENSLKIKLKIKDIAVSPNNIKKIERLQKYFTYYNKGNINSQRKLEFNEAKEGGSLEFIKRIHRKIVKYKKEIKELSSLICKKEFLRKKIEFIAKIIRIQNKIYQIEIILKSRKIPINLVELNLLESANLFDFNLIKCKKTEFDFCKNSILTLLDFCQNETIINEILIILIGKFMIKQSEKQLYEMLKLKKNHNNVRYEIIQTLLFIKKYKKL